MVQITAQLVTMVGTPALTLLTMVPVLRKYTKKLIPFVQQNAPAIAAVANGVEHLAEDALQLPKVAALEAELTAKLDALKKSELVKVAGLALHAYERSFDTLTPNEKGTLLTFVRTSMGKVGVTVTNAEVLDALGVAQKLADDFKATDAFQNTAALEASLKALEETVTTQQVTDTTPTAPTQATS